MSSSSWFQLRSKGFAKPKGCWSSGISESAMEHRPWAPHHNRWPSWARSHTSFTYSRRGKSFSRPQPGPQLGGPTIGSTSWGSDDCQRFSCQHIFRICQDDQDVAWSSVEWPKQDKLTQIWCSEAPRFCLVATRRISRTHQSRSYWSDFWGSSEGYHGHLWPYHPVTCDPIIPGHLRPYYPVTCDPIPLITLTPPAFH